MKKLPEDFSLTGLLRLLPSETEKAIYANSADNMLTLQFLVMSRGSPYRQLHWHMLPSFEHETTSEEDLVLHRSR